MTGGFRAFWLLINIYHIKPPRGVLLRFSGFSGWTRSLIYQLGSIVLSGVLSVSGGRAWGGYDEVNLRCSVCYLIVLPFPLPRSCILEGNFSTCRARRGWLTSPLFVALSASASVQAHYFLYGVSYCCHPVSCLSDVSLLSEVKLPVSYSI